MATRWRRRSTYLLGEKNANARGPQEAIRAPQKGVEEKDVVRQPYVFSALRLAGDPFPLSAALFIAANRAPELSPGRTGSALGSSVVHLPQCGWRKHTNTRRRTKDRSSPHRSSPRNGLLAARVGGWAQALKAEHRGVRGSTCPGSVSRDRRQMAFIQREETSASS